MIKVGSRTWSLLILPTIICLFVGWTWEVDQPIHYSHQVHVLELELECADCHVNAETRARAVIPNIELCANCHVDTEDEDLEARQVAIYAEQGKRIPWSQVHSVPDYAYFSHRRHVKLGEIQCEHCHGEVSEMQDPFTEPYLSMDMEWCMECHEQRGVSNDCYACHR